MAVLTQLCHHRLRLDSESSFGSEASKSRAGLNIDNAVHPLNTQPSPAGYRFISIMLTEYTLWGPFHQAIDALKVLLADANVNHSHVFTLPSSDRDEARKALEERKKILKGPRRTAEDGERTCFRA